MGHWSSRAAQQTTQPPANHPRITLPGAYLKHRKKYAKQRLPRSAPCCTLTQVRTIQPANHAAQGSPAEASPAEAPPPPVGHRAAALGPGLLELDVNLRPDGVPKGFAFATFDSVPNATRADRAAPGVAPRATTKPSHRHE